MERLVSADLASHLPEAPPGAAALNDLLVRVRLDSRYGEG
jgi:hypothetical protein